MDIETQIQNANQRLKNAKMGICIMQRGSKLSLRGMLPPKDGNGKKTQQTIALDIYANPAGIKRAEAEAQKVASQLALKEFDWSIYLVEKSPVESVGDWVERFCADYFSKRKRSPKTETTYRTEYITVFNALPKHEDLTPELLKAIILKTEPDSRTRKRFCMVANKLAFLAGLEFDATPFIGDYSPKAVSPRQLPTDEEISSYRNQIPNREWQYVFGLMSCYGIRNHEVFNCDLSSLKKAPGILTVLDGKTGSRRIWPCYPEWWDRWELWDIDSLPLVTGADNSALGGRVTQALKRYGFVKPYNLRHAWAVRSLEFGLDVSLAAAQMGHSVKVHSCTYHHWITDRTHQKAFEALMARSDRPLAP